MTKFDAFYEVIRDYNAEKTTVNTIDLLGYDLANDRAIEEDLKDAARYLISAMEGRPDNWLSFDVYRRNDGEFKAEILITCGGPTVYVEYESVSDELCFKYYAGGAVVSTLISTEECTAGGELVETIKEIACSLESSARCALETH